MELLRITRQIHCKAVEQRATLIHRQYNRDWVTSYSRPPMDPYLTSPRYKILAAPLLRTVYRLSWLCLSVCVAGERDRGPVCHGPGRGHGAVGIRCVPSVPRATHRYTAVGTIDSVFKQPLDCASHGEPIVPTSSANRKCSATHPGTAHPAPAHTRHRRTDSEYAECTSTYKFSVLH